MNAKEFVKKKMPKAKSEKQKTNGVFGNTYWLIRNGRDSMWFSEGKTESNAWVNAKKRIEEIDREKSNTISSIDNTKN